MNTLQNGAGNYAMHSGTVVQPVVMVLLAAFIFSGCRDDRPAEKKTVVAGHHDADTAVNYDALLTGILTLQDAVYLHPRDRRLIAELCNGAFDSTSGSFFTAGKGAAPSRHPESAWYAARKTAASNDARRWALYLKAWHNGDTRPFGQEIQGEIVYTRILSERLIDDTLYQLLQIPLGSIIVR